MNDFDIEALAFAEHKAKELKKAAIEHFKIAAKCARRALAVETRDLFAAVELAINSIKPADKKFTLGQIATMRKVLEKYRLESVPIVHEIDSKIELLGRYAETYIADGVSPQDLDIGGGDVHMWLVPLRALFLRLTNDIAVIHTLAYGIFADIDFDAWKWMVSSCEVDLELVASAKKIHGYINALNEQNLSFMSGEGIDERERIIQGFAKFCKCLSVFSETKTQSPA
ncbi:MAG TPA: hypothetical protein VFT82_03675 [Candidatus Paceibacterota bacterium]|nr:hypothetical protein [Candidatus Paceibacterota bacterium]